MNNPFVKRTVETTGADYRRFLNPETVSKLNNMSLIARLVVEGFITGLHRSPYHGFSVEFAEHRPYMPGDDLRRLDWKVLGKTDRLYLKEYEEETNLRTYLLVDASASMDFRSGQVSKLQYASWLAASLSYLMLRQRDAVGLVTYSDHIRKLLPPRSINSYLHILLQELQNTSGQGETRIGRIFHQLAERMPRRGLLIIFSDLFDHPQEILSGLKHFRHNHHEVIVFHILDPLERRFDFKQAGTFLDVETGEKLSTQPWHIRTEYRRSIDEFIDTLKKGCREQRIDYALMDTQEDFDRALLQYLIKRKRIGG
ncbi:MAG TPA: DUF58 domain-containing protein [bacterium]|nr:DUF58 domain-containing protein [bacterium]HPN34063.1 DUF58 domain-containing protein [bacterium]